MGRCDHKPTATQWEDGTSQLARTLGLEPGWHPDYATWWDETTCAHGNCVVLLCPECGADTGNGHGPADCPCAALPDSLWHRTVGTVWKWTGMRVWHRNVRRLLARDTTKEGT